MKVKWAHKAKIDYVDTLSYWKDRNVSTLYSQKIDTAVLKLEKEIAANPYFLAKYNHKLNLYRRSFMRGRYYPDTIYTTASMSLRVSSLSYTSQIPL